MKKVFILLGVSICLAMIATPVQAFGLGVSPASIELDVSADGSASQTFKIYKFIGDVNVEIEDIPLRMEPSTVSVMEEGQRVVLTFYGNEDLGTEAYDGYIKFMGMGGENIGVAVKVKTTIHHIAQSSNTMPILNQIGIVVATGILIGMLIYFTVIRRKHAEI